MDERRVEGYSHPQVIDHENSPSGARLREIAVDDGIGKPIAKGIQPLGVEKAVLGGPKAVAGMHELSKAYGMKSRCSHRPSVA